MVSISSSYSSKSGKFSAHLVPTTTVAPLSINSNNNNNNDDVLSFELADDTTEDDYDESKDLIVIEITSIIILVIICGVGYALFRCVVDRRDAQRELKILMSPTGLGLLENENRNGQSNQMSTNAKTLNDAFEIAPDGTTKFKLLHTDT